MNRRRIKTIFLIVLFPLIAACNSNPTKQEIGTVSGAVVGGIVGTSLTGSSVGTIGGAAAGAYVGNRIGKELERK